MSSPPTKRQRTETRCIYFGPQPKEVNSETLKLVLRDFKTLEQIKPGEYTKVEFMAFDRSWSIRVYPRGRKEVNKCVFGLFCKDASMANPVEVSLQLQIKTSSKTENASSRHTYQNQSSGSFWYWDQVNFSNILDHCLDAEGNFVIDLKLQIYVEKKPIWYPKQKLSIENNVLSGKQMLDSASESDIAFLVGKGNDRVPAHRIILHQRAAGLYEFIKDLPHNSTFEVSNMDVPTFKLLLDYIYTGHIPQDLFPKDRNDDAATDDDVIDDDIFDFAKKLLSAANLYGLTYLKVYIESEITAKVLNYQNAADWLPIADAQVCPMLKEHCMKMFLRDKDKFKSSSSGWKQIKESSDLLEELLFYKDESCEATVLNPIDDDNDDNDDMYYKKMSIRMLREELDSNDLDLDGTKEILIQRLKNFREQKLALCEEIHI